MIKKRNWLALKLCALLATVEYFSTGECNLTVTPGDITCPGVDMAFICRHRALANGGTVSNVRWRLTHDGTDVVPQLALTQGRGCPHLYEYYNRHLIMITLYDSYSTLNVTADDQLDGLVVECVLISDTVETEMLQIQITQQPSSPTGVHILSIHNGSYSATVELVWDSFGLSNSEEIGNVTYVITISSNGEIWTKTVARENGKTSITLSYNTNYRLDVVATNCAGDSEDFVTLNILIANCSAPILNTGVIAEPYNDTVEGAVVYFDCIRGFPSSEQRMAVCQHSGHWSPKTSSIRCEQTNNSISYQILQDLILKQEEVCKKSSGSFLAVCTRWENTTLNCSAGCSHKEKDHGSGFIIGGVAAASFLLGMACCVCVLLTLLYIIKKKIKCDDRSTQKNGNELRMSENMAYETVQFPTTSQNIQH